MKKKNSFRFEKCKSCPAGGAGPCADVDSCAEISYEVDEMPCLRETGGVYDFP